MAICFDEKTQAFYLHTKTTSYVIGLLEGVYPIHLYYGKKIDSYPDFMENLPTRSSGAFSGSDMDVMSTDTITLEYPVYGSADLRSPALHVRYQNGSAISKLTYTGYEIVDGKEALVGLPATYVEDQAEAQTLKLYLKDAMSGLAVTLRYTAFEAVDAIAKSVTVTNQGDGDMQIERIFSATGHLFDKDFDFVHLAGGWARERHIEKQPLSNSIVSVGSSRGASSHMHSPFVALARKTATETYGDVYGYSLLYSGNFLAEAYVDHYDTVRINMGINPFDFGWKLQPGESFTAPEVISVYSDEGYGKMSRTFHQLYRTRLCRGKYRDQERPVLINNWEATYFDFNEEKILSIAAQAKELGVELMVLDDGWFGKRDSDNCSLGDWIVDRKKLPNGIDGLANKVVDMGMQFGLWFEPEMVSPDSDLYRAHPDWCIHAEGRDRTVSRHQLILDLSRDEVCDYVIGFLTDILSSAPISYVKWDMNRNFAEPNSAALPAEQQQELPHRYMLGLYKILDHITKAFPEVLFEGCSGGGGRFDAGMLPYFPQYWTSDDSDAIERLYIQHGTSMVMPGCTMGAHVSAVPNHQLGRTTPLTTRGHVAMFGQFGYELDLTKLPQEELDEMKEQIRLYKEIRTTVHNGAMYRLKSPFEGQVTAWECVAEDQSQVVLMVCTILSKVQTGRVNVKLQGLEPDEVYEEKTTGRQYTGTYLMHVGLYFDCDADFQSQMLVWNRK